MLPLARLDNDSRYVGYSEYFDKTKNMFYGYNFSIKSFQQTVHHCLRKFHVWTNFRNSFAPPQSSPLLRSD